MLEVMRLPVCALRGQWGYLRKVFVQIRDIDVRHVLGSYLDDLLIFPVSNNTIHYSSQATTLILEWILEYVSHSSYPFRYSRLLFLFTRSNFRQERGWLTRMRENSKSGWTIGRARRERWRECRLRQMSVWFSKTPVRLVHPEIAARSTRIFCIWMLLFWAWPAGERKVDGHVQTNNNYILHILLLRELLSFRSYSLYVYKSVILLYSRCIWKWSLRSASKGPLIEPVSHSV